MQVKVTKNTYSYLLQVWSLSMMQLSIWENNEKFVSFSNHYSNKIFQLYVL